MRRNALGVRRSWFLEALATTLVVAAPLPALAEGATPSASDISLARSLGSEGVQLADAGNCAAAIDKLDRAEKLYHAPPLLGRLGECQVQIGKIVAGTENLQRVVRESLPAKAPKAFVDAQARAQKVLDASLPKLAKLKLHIEAPPGTNFNITQDGETVPVATLDLERPTDPGTHKIEVTATGFRTARAETTLTEGGTGAVNMRLEPDASAALPTAPPTAAPTTSTPPSATPTSPASATPIAESNAASAAPAANESSGSSKLPAILVMSAGGVGLGVGAVFGLMTLAKKTELDGICGAKTHCPSSAQGDIDAMNTSSLVSTVGFIAGGALIGTGVIMLIASKSSSTTGRDGGSSHASVIPYVGPGSLGVTGSF